MAVLVASSSVVLLVIVATAVFWWRAARWDGAHLAGPAALAFGSGLVTAGLGAGHLVGVAITEFRRRVPEYYTFRVYALGLLGVVLVTLGTRLVISAIGVARGQASAWRNAFTAEVVLLLLILPLAYIDAFAVALSIFASIGLASLLVIRLRTALSKRAIALAGRATG